MSSTGAGAEPGRSPSPRPDRREEILTAAAALLAEGGPGAVSVRAVAARAGLGASTVRYWFPSQDDLALAVASRTLTGILEDRRIAESDVPAAERLTECLVQFLPAPGTADDLAAAQAQGWLSFVVASAGPGATALGGALYARMLGTTRERVEAWLHRLAGEGALTADAVPDAALALLTRVDGLMLGLVLPGSTLTPGRAHAILADDVEHLLGRGADRARD